MSIDGVGSGADPSVLIIHQRGVGPVGFVRVGADRISLSELRTRMEQELPDLLPPSFGFLLDGIPVSSSQEDTESVAVPCIGGVFIHARAETAAASSSLTAHAADPSADTGGHPASMSVREWLDAFAELTRSEQQQACQALAAAEPQLLRQVCPEEPTGLEQQLRSMFNATKQAQAATPTTPTQRHLARQRPASAPRSRPPPRGFDAAVAAAGLSTPPRTGGRLGASPAARRPSPSPLRFELPYDRHSACESAATEQAMSACSPGKVQASPRRLVSRSKCSELHRTATIASYMRELQANAAHHAAPKRNVTPVIMGSGRASLAHNTWISDLRPSSNSPLRANTRPDRHGAGEGRSPTGSSPLDSNSNSIAQ